MKSIRLVVALSVLTLLILPLPEASTSPTRPSDRSEVNPERADVNVITIPAQAHVHGKYRHLLRVLDLPEDVQSYNQFTDWGLWNGTEWRGHKNIPAGYWVYVYPRWYIWKELTPVPPAKAGVGN